MESSQEEQVSLIDRLLTLLTGIVIGNYEEGNVIRTGDWFVNFFLRSFPHLLNSFLDLFSLYNKCFVKHSQLNFNRKNIQLLFNLSGIVFF